MKEVYSAPDVIVAHLFQAFLDERGIPAEVTGEDLTSLAWELPIAESRPVVFVVDDGDYERARELVAEFEGGGPPAVTEDGPWTCVRCGESLSAQFTACWKCGCDRPAAKKEAGAGAGRSAPRGEADDT